MKNNHFVAVITALVLFAATAFVGARSAADVNAARQSVVTGQVERISELLRPSAVIDLPNRPFMARIDVVGTIGPASADSLYGSYGGYDHALYMDLVDALMDDDNNKGILLYVDSPGGTVYESDEFYLKLMEYRETTGRPIYAYFASEACSGGYYVSMAANEIYANRNAWTGSIGVIISLLNYQGLSEKIGVTEVNVTSGKNKSMGSAWETLTDEQRAILQSLVDESYRQFVDIVSAGRNLDRETLLPIADGRIYSAQQALDLSLIDHIAGEEEAFSAILSAVGLDPDDTFYAPDRSSPFDFLSLLYRAADLQPKSDLQLFQELLNDNRNGALMYYAR